MKFAVEFVEAIVLVVIMACLVGCQAVNSKFGCDNTDYTAATELPQLKLPPDSLALSHRYDIPEIPGNKDLIISNNAPPDYY